MNLPKVPFKCVKCGYQGIYITLINWKEVQLACKHGCGRVETQKPLTEVEIERMQEAVEEEINERRLDLFYAAVGM